MVWRKFVFYPSEQTHGIFFIRTCWSFMNFKLCILKHSENFINIDLQAIIANEKFRFSLCQMCIVRKYDITIIPPLFHLTLFSNKESEQFNLEYSKTLLFLRTNCKLIRVKIYTIARCAKNCCWISSQITFKQLYERKETFHKVVR